MTTFRHLQKEDSPLANKSLWMSFVDILKLNEKDPHWLQLEICREFQRQRCPRAESDCKYSHVPHHVSVVEGRVTACYDSIRGRCHRKQPACKYFHPPPHLAQQLLANGRKYLELKNLILGQLAGAAQVQGQGQGQGQGQVPMCLPQGLGGYVQSHVPYMMQRPVTMPNLGAPASYIYPPPTIVSSSKSPQINLPLSCETIPYPGMLLYKKSVEYKPALYPPGGPFAYFKPATVVPSSSGVDFSQVISHKVAKGMYGQRINRY